MALANTRPEQGAVMTCSVSDCSYNQQLECCAPNVTVGNGHPVCETYTDYPVRRVSTGSFVATCLTTMCAFNRQTRCTAPGVTLDCHGDHADCATFRT